jgi:ribonucleoside-diphosphate reductase alpha chain
MNKQKYYWLNKDSRKFLSRGYLLENETAEERIWQIANHAEKLLRIEAFASKFEDYLARGWYSLSSPIWSNFGRTRGLPISCFGSYISDTMEDILEKVAEVGMMTKTGGGTSAYFGALRGRGAKISSGGESTGSVHFMEIYDKLMNVVSQGNVRRGSFAAYLPIDHPDIEEFLTVRDAGHTIQEMSLGVCISDEFMNKILDGDKHSRKIWGKVIKKRFETGYPYIFFSDNANNHAPQVYKDKGYIINHSNLCVTGNQRVVSNHGILTAKELYERGEDLVLFDNKKMVNSTPMQLIEKDADVYRVNLSNGLSHEITSYHKIVVSEKDQQGAEHEKNVACSDLKIGDRVAFQTEKGIFGNENKQAEAFLLGLYQADGTQHKDTVMIDVWENDFDLIPLIEEKFEYIHYSYNCNVYSIPNKKGVHIERNIEPAKFHDCVVYNGSVNKKRLASKTLKKALNFEKGYVPQWIWESDEATHWEYIKGLLYADGTANLGDSDGNPIQISLANINKDFLKEIQIILCNLGVKSSIRILRKQGETLLPDGRGGHKLYNTKDCWRLIIGNKNDAIKVEKHTGFLSRKNIKLEKDEYRDNSKKYSKIVSIEYIGKEDVYCCTVDSEEHHWICNGFITHNCSEIMLPNNKDESFVCDLSSMNLLHYDEWKDTDAVEILVYFLDAVMTEFIDKTENMKFMQAPRNFAINHRALGVGVLGWHSLLQEKMISFESLEANMLNIQIWKNIRKNADLASEKLAQLLGEPPLLKGYGRRNTTTLAVAPTTSSSFILGQVSPSIEPLNSNYYVKDLAKGKFTYKNFHLEKLLEEKGKNDLETWNSILLKGGSVQHLSFLSQHEKDVFKTFGEISQKEIIIQAAERQKEIDQGQSLNVQVPPNTPAKQVSDLYILAWQKKVKALYYQRSANPAQELARNIMSCSTCEG